MAKTNNRKKSLSKIKVGADLHPKSRKAMQMRRAMHRDAGIVWSRVDTNGLDSCGAGKEGITQATGRTNTKDR